MPNGTPARDGPVGGFACPATELPSQEPGGDGAGYGEGERQQPVALGIPPPGHGAQQRGPADRRGRGEQAELLTGGPGGVGHPALVEPELMGEQLGGIPDADREQGERDHGERLGGPEHSSRQARRRVPPYRPWLAREGVAVLLGPRVIDGHVTSRPLHAGTPQLRGPTTPRGCMVPESRAFRYPR